MNIDRVKDINVLNFRGGFFSYWISQIVKIGERRIFTEKKIFSICVLNV
jgi:hypothetical protein